MPSRLWLASVSAVLWMLVRADRRADVLGDLIELRELRHGIGRRDIGRATAADLMGLLRGWQRPWFRGRRGMWQDIVYSWRGLRRAPMATTAIVITLALGIGATGAVVAALDGLLLRPLPYPAPDRLVYVGSAPIRIASLRLVDRKFLALPEVTAAGVWATGGANLELGTESDRVVVGTVDDGFFNTMGVAPMLGNTLPPPDGQSRLAVMSFELWRRRFGSDRAIVGRSITLNGHPYSVVGVMPPGFSYPDDASLWIPVKVDYQMTGSAFAPSVVARLAPGVSIARAEEAVRAYRQADYAAAGRAAPAAPPESLVTPLQQFLTTRVRSTLIYLSITVSLLLLVVCASVANVLLARLSSRAHELAVRRSLGARTTTLVRQLIAESALLTLGGCLSGFTLAVWALTALQRLAGESLAGLDLVSAGGRLVLVASAIAVTVVALVSVIPIAVLVRRRPNLVRSGDALRTPGWHRLRGALIAAQMALALMLLTAGAASIGALREVSRIELGFGGPTTVAASATLPMARYTTFAAKTQFLDRVVDELEALPGVKRAAVTGALPGNREVGVGARLKVPGVVPKPGTEPRSATLLHASAGYFSIMGTRLVAGREFGRDDRLGAPPVVILSETAATNVFGSAAAAVGRQVVFPFEHLSSGHLVIGVVADMRMRDSQLSGPSGGQVYLAASQEPPWATVSIVAEVETSIDDGLAALRTATARVDPSIPLYDVQAIDTIADRYLASHRLAGWLISAFAVVTVLVAAIGLSGLMAQSVAERMREIGIRMALGATTPQLNRRIVGSALMIAVVGGLVGAVAAAGGLQVLQSIVPGLAEVGVGILSVNLAILGASALAAAWWPAMRVRRIDPVRVLRD